MVVHLSWQATTHLVTSTAVLAPPVVLLVPPFASFASHKEDEAIVLLGFLLLLLHLLHLLLLACQEEVNPGCPLLLQDLDRSKDDLPMVCVLDPDLHQVIVAHQLDRLEVLVAVLLKVVDVCRDGKELKPVRTMLGFTCRCC